MLDLQFYLVATERPLINIDSTLFINMGLWLLLFLLLRGLLWQPMIRLIAAREEGMEGARAQARRLQAEARKKKAEYEAALKQARIAAAAERDRLRTEALRKESEIIAQARAAMNAAVEAQRAELRRQREILRAEVQAAVPALAKEIVTKVLGREVRL